MTVCTFCLGDNKLKPSLLLSPTTLVFSSSSSSLTTNTSSSYSNSSSTTSNSSFEVSTFSPLKTPAGSKKSSTSLKKKAKDLNNNTVKDASFAMLSNGATNNTAAYSIINPTPAKKNKLQSFWKVFCFCFRFVLF